MTGDGVHIWELTVAAAVVISLIYWRAFCGTRFTLGVLCGFTLAFGWTWLMDMPFLLRLSFAPNSFGGFVVAGHWEPLWTAFSYCCLALPILAYLHHRTWLKSRFGLAVYPLIGFGAGVLIMFYEGGLGVLTLHAETYHWRPEYLLLGVPWTSTFGLIPLLILLPLFFIEQAERMLIAAGEPILAARGSNGKASLGGWPSFWVGFAAPQAGMYFTCLVMIPILDWLKPWPA